MQLDPSGTKSRGKTRPVHVRAHERTSDLMRDDLGGTFADKEPAQTDKLADAPSPPGLRTHSMGTRLDCANAPNGKIPSA